MMRLVHAAWKHGTRRARRRRGHDAAAFDGSYKEALEARTDTSALGDLFYDHDGRAVYKWTHYLPAYDEQLQKYRRGFPLANGGHRPLRVLELGVFHGGSLQLWRRYFGPEALIWGIDVNPDCAAVTDPDLVVRIGSQADPGFLRSVVSEMGGIDVVIDDGSHIAKHQRASFGILFPLLADGGTYAVEDTHTSYWLDYGGGYRGRRSFLGLTKDVVDDMHSWYHGHRPRLTIDAKSWVPKVVIYDSVVVIEKTARPRPMVVRFGEDSF